MDTAAVLPLHGKRVLIIEDNTSLLRHIASWLASAGALVQATAEGARGLQAFRDAAPDLVVTDIIMPDREGIEIILEMKARRPDTPILAISGGGRIAATEILDLARRLGADRVLAKPFQRDDIVRRAAEMLGA